MKSIDVQQEVGRIVAFIKKTFNQAGFSDAVVGLSGGIDSAVSFTLAVQALGVDHVYPILLPYGVLSTKGVLDAMKVIEVSHIPLTHVVRIDIQQAVDAIVRVDPMMDKVRKGNIMARTRMIHLFDQAKKRKALVVGTENKSEHLLGYYTRYGDEASDVEPIRHLYKTQIYEAAKHLHIPDEIIQKPPSADLWPKQTDEGEFGFTYKDADEILFLIFDQDKSEEYVLQIGKSHQQATTVLSRLKENNFKRLLPHNISML